MRKTASVCQPESSIIIILTTNYGKNSYIYNISVAVSRDVITGIGSEH